MDWAIAYAAASMIALAVISIIYLFVYLQDHHRFLAIWATSWALNAGHFCLLALDVDAVPVTILAYLLQLTSALWLLWGVGAFFDSEQSPYWLRVTALVGAGLVIGQIAGLDEWARVPAALMSAILYLRSGSLILRPDLIDSPYQRRAGWTLVALAIYHPLEFAYASVDGLQPYGYLLAAALQLLVVLSLLLVYYERIRTELRDSEQRFRLLADNAQDIIFRIQRLPARQMTYISPAVEAISGYAPAEYYADPAITLKAIHPESRDVLNAVLNGEKYPQTLVLRGKHKDGRTYWLEQRHGFVYGDGGEIVAVEGIARDITERKEAETQLQAYATRLQALRSIDQAILRAETPEAIGLAALANLHSLLDCQHASIMLFDADLTEGTLLATLVNQEVSLRRGDPFLLATWRGFNSLRDGTMYQGINNPLAEQQDGFAAYLSQLKIQSLISIPFMDQHKPFGALTLGLIGKNTFSPQQIEIAQEVAGQLAIAIQQADLHAREQQHRAELEERVAARTAELQQANEQLQELTHVKDQFVSNVTHELRTPLTNFKLHLQLLDRRPDQSERYLATLGHETRRLETLIESLLLLSRLDQSRMKFEYTAIDLNRLIRGLIDDRQVMAQAEELQLTSDLRPDLPAAHADANLIVQVLSILLTNALQYTPAGGQVTISTHCAADHTNRVGFSVSDTGPGIPPGEQDNLFKRFFRGSAGLDSGVSGTGLGLAIAHEIIERHQGCIAAESTGIPGEGATFRVWLPMS